MSPRVVTIALRSGAGAEGWKAANDAANAGDGDILLFVPVGVVPASDLNPRIARAYTDGATRVVLGDVAAAPGSHALARLRRATGHDKSPEPADFPGQVFAVPASLFRAASGFAEDLRWGAEVDLAFRLTVLGGELVRLGGAAGRRSRAICAGEVVRERLAAGQGSVELYRRTPALLPHLELGRFHSASPPGLGLRCRLLGLGGPPMPPALGRLLPTRSQRQGWLSFQFEYHYWRGVAREMRGTEWEGLLRPPVILMYHAIGRPGERAGAYIVPLGRFRRQMRWLALRGYRVISLQELVECRRAFRPAPPRSVVITFDDGYADNGELAGPVLRAHGFPATVFMVSGSIGGRNTWDDRGELAGRAILTRDAAGAVADAGIEIGVHTRTHPNLTEVSDDALADEIVGARRDLELAVGRPMRAFAYPFGRLDDRVAAAVAAAGFEAACCSRSGRNDPAVPSLRLRRVEVRGTDSLLRFALAVRRGWVRRRRRP